MRLGQPNMQRENTRFHSETDEEYDEQRDDVSTLFTVERQRIERCGQAARIQRDESHQQEQKTHMHQNQVAECGPAHFAALGIEQHQHERRQRHHLPREQEAESVAQRHDQQHRQVQNAQAAIVQRDLCRGFAAQIGLYITFRINQHRDGRQRQYNEEKGRQRIGNAVLRTENDIDSLGINSPSAGKHPDSLIQGRQYAEADDTESDLPFPPHRNRKNGQRQQHQCYNGLDKHTRG